MAARLAGWFGLARFPVGFGLEAGMRSGPPGFAGPSSSAIPRSNRSIIRYSSRTVARSWTMMAMRAARSAVLRSTSVSMPSV